MGTGKASKGCHGSKDVEKRVTDLVVEGLFADFSAAKKVITKRVKKRRAVADAAGATQGCRE